MVRQFMSRLAEALVGVAAGFGLLLLPAAWALREYRPVAFDGIETLDDAVATSGSPCSAAGSWSPMLNA